MLYIKKLIICDQYDQDIFRVERTPAVKGLQDALRIVDEKEGRKSFKAIFKGYMDRLDKEFQEYFDMGQR